MAIAIAIAISLSTIVNIPNQLAAAATQGTTTLISQSTNGGFGDGSSDGPPSLSADGRYIAFHSHATNLVPGDTNGVADAFVRDRQLGTTTLVSVSSEGAQGNEDSEFSSISADGRYIAFHSYATNLVPDDTNEAADAFVRDRQLGTTTLVSVSSEGAQGNRNSDLPSISADGRYIAFRSGATNLVPDDTNDFEDAFVRDRQLGTTTLVSVSSGGAQGNRDSYFTSISADGRYVAFSSGATNLVSGDTNEFEDAFVRDRQLGTTTLVSVSSGGAQGNDDSFFSSISADGRYIAFGSVATNLVPGDTNGAANLFVVDRATARFITRPSEQLFGTRSSSAYASDPVNTATGNFIQEATDLSFPVSGLDLTRSYNSLDTTAGPLGQGWHFGFDTRVAEAPGGEVAFTDFDGRQVSFVPTGTGGYTRPEEFFADLVKMPDGTFELRYFSGETWAFDSSGRLAEKRFWDGQRVTLAYDTSGHLVSATSTTGHGLTFTYNGERVTRVEANDGRAVMYSYDPAGNLTSGTDPTGAITHYELDATGRITKITDPDGVMVIENTYGADGRVSHQSMASGADTTFSYDDETGRTTVTDATTGAAVVYLHDTDGRLTAIVDPYGMELSKSYDSSGNLIGVVDRLGAGTNQT
ncbi:MAG: DUF6531 domain-containing protein, partial [Acidimicrobiales bacterium]